MRNVIDVLRERGFIEAVTSEEVRALAEKPLSVYCGFDPTSDSLHIGNMVAIMGLAWFQRCGHKPVAIVGGATGMIGDPTGRKAERSFLDENTLATNLIGITKNLEQVLDFKSENKPLVLNNYDWFKNFTFIDFLRTVGVNFRMGPMLAKESVRARMESEDGMSFTEFSYQLLQGYDFLHLHREYGVSIQLGGSDQWGNITAGSDLTRKVSGDQVYGITFPLLTNNEGQKFGKSEKGAIWMSPDKLSYFDFYQYLFRTHDDDVIKLMRLLTFMDIDEIRHYEQMIKNSDYTPQTAQKRLAEEVTRIVHGEKGLEIALKVTEGAKPGAETSLDAKTLEAISGDMPCKTLTKGEVVGANIINLIVHAGFQPSKSAVRRLILNGGLYLNNEQVSNEELSISDRDLIEDRFVLIALGKKNKVLIRIE